MKQRMGLLLALLVGALVLTGCNSMSRQPHFEKAALTPSPLKPGETAILSATVVDKYGLVKRVEGIVKEDPAQKFKLQSAGPAKEKTGEQTWSLKVDVPFKAPPGTFTVELTGYGPDDSPLIVRAGKDVKGPLKATVPLVISNP